MRYIIWTIRIIVLIFVFAFLHYTLPQRDIVRIVATFEERADFGGFTDIFWQNTGNATAENPITRDVLYIQTRGPDDTVRVYRNQDTGWGWPPYFKFDTANLQTEAADAASTAAAPQWYAVRHYGWRITWLGDGIFPNALSMRPVDGPDAQLIPWFNIVVLTILFIITASIWRLWRSFRMARIDPVIEDIDETADEARGAVGRFFSRFRRK